MMRKITVVCAVLSGCAFVEEGIPSDESSSSSSGGETFTQSETATMGTTGTSTSMSTTSSATSQGPSSTEDSGASSGETSESSSTSEASGSETSTGELANDYGPCSSSMDPACSAPADTCVWTDGVDDGIAPAGWCARECNTADDCPVPETGTAEVGCTYYGELPLKCILRCSDGATCPDGMVCLVHMFTPEFGNEYDHMCAWST